MKIVDLFTFVTSFSGYTCDYTDSDGGTYEGVRRGFNELGTFEDIIQAGAAQAQGAAVAMLFGESANPWRPFGGTAGAG